MLNFLAINLVPYWNLSHSLFNPRLSSLVPLKILLVECKKQCFRLQNTRDLLFLEKNALGKAAPHRISEWRCNNNLQENGPMQASVLNGSIFRKSYLYMGWHDPWPCTSSENHTRVWVRGSKGAIFRTCSTELRIWGKREGRETVIRRRSRQDSACEAWHQPI